MRSGMALTKLLIVDLMSRYTQQISFKGKATKWLVVLLPLLLLMPVIQMAMQLHVLFSKIGHSELAVTYMVAGLVPLLMIAAIPMVMSLFFFSKDLGFLSSMPLTRNQIVLSKSAVIYFYIGVVSYFSLMPSVIIYSFVDAFRPVAFILGTLALSVIPVFPVALAVLLTIPMMRLIGNTKRRGLWLLLGNLLLLVVIIGIQVALARLQIATSTGADASTLSMSENGLLYIVGQKFWPSVWLTQMLLGDGLAALGYYGISFGVAFFVFLLIQWIYKGAMQAYHEVSGQSTGQKTARYKGVRQSVFFRLVWRHIGIVLGNPTFALQIGMSMLVPLLVAGVTLLTGEINLDLLKSPSFIPYVPYLFLGVLMSPILMGTVSATVITREGKSFWETRVLPISHHMNLQSRIFSSDLMCLVAMALLGLFALWLLPISGLDALVAIGLALAITRFFNVIDLYINVSRPLLNWSHPTAAVKNNLNIMLALVLRMAVCLPLFYGAQALPFDAFYQKALAVLALIGLLYAIEEKVFYPKLIEDFRKMEW